jgi:acyl-coenzyme A synthetase/AMP-(fatty) acid ligase
MDAPFFDQFEEESLWTDEFVEEMHSLAMWGELSMSDYLDRHVSKRGDEIAVRDEQRALTWRDLREEADRVAAGLSELGVERGDRVSLQIPNRVEWFVSRLGILRAGAVVSTMMPRFRRKEMTHLVETVEPTAYIGPTDYGDYDHVETIQDIQSDVPTLDHVIAYGDSTPDGAISFARLLESSTEDFTPQNIHPDYPDRLKTSGGTTGLPKVVYRPLNPWVGILGPTLERFGITKYDRIMGMAPLPHGITTPLASVGTMLIGSTSIVTESSKPPEEHWAAIDEFEPTVVTAAPTQLNKMMNVDARDDYSLDSLRVLFYSGEPLPKRTADFFEERGVTITSYYGAAVAGAPIVTSPTEDAEISTTTAGKVIRGSEVRIVDKDGNECDPGEVGEITWAGATVTPGYFDNPDENENAFERDTNGWHWFYSDDAASMDADGNVSIHGRLDDMILRGGTNIFPAPIEDTIMEHDAVNEVAVIGMPDPEYGERPCAYVVSDEEITLADITTFLESKGLAKYKWPERLEVVDSLPKTAAGKIQKDELESDIQQKLQNEGELQP